MAGATSTCTTLAADCRLVVVAPIPGSPAEGAGLLAGDVIQAIDGQRLEAPRSTAAARDRVRGAKDTAVTLSIVREGAPPFDVEIVRAVIVTPEVETENLAQGAVGYIRLSGFSDHAAAQFDAAVAAAVERGQRALIVDLRGNPGGYVTAARDIASQFLADGRSSGRSTRTEAGRDRRPARRRRRPTRRSRIVALVDGGSASASEIVAGALRDRGRATLVGSTTFGKEPSSSGRSSRTTTAASASTAKWLTPDKVWIHGTGIEPDVSWTRRQQPRRRPGHRRGARGPGQATGSRWATGVSALLRNRRLTGIATAGYGR